MPVCPQRVPSTETALPPRAQKFSADGEIFKSAHAGSVLLLQKSVVNLAVEIYRPKQSAFKNPV